MRIVAVWLVAAVVWAAFVALTSIGPVVASFGWRHGIHATDLVVGAGAVAVAAVATHHEVAPGRRRPLVPAPRTPAATTPERV